MRPGITVRQYGDEFRPNLNENNVKVVEEDLPGWEATFSSWSNVILEEHSVPSWTSGAQEGATRQVCSVRFTCTKPPTHRDISEYVSREDEGVIPAQMDTDNLASEYPIAKFCRGSVVGKEVRLEIVRTTNKKRQKYRWRWPEMVKYLAGQRFKLTRDPDLNDPLNEWAEKHKNRLVAGQGQLIKIEGYGGRVQWRLETTSQAAPPAFQRGPAMTSFPTSSTSSFQFPPTTSYTPFLPTWPAPIPSASPSLPPPQTSFPAVAIPQHRAPNETISDEALANTIEELVSRRLEASTVSTELVVEMGKLQRILSEKQRTFAKLSKTLVDIDQRLSEARGLQNGRRAQEDGSKRGRGQ